MATVWTKETIREWLEKADTTKQSHREAIGKMVSKLYNYQMADEQATESTGHNNGVGFNGTDAKFLSRMAKWFNDKGFLTPNQAEPTRKCLRKYSGQLAKIRQAEQPQKQLFN
jgi:hypothetical protein